MTLERLKRETTKIGRHGCAVCGHPTAALTMVAIDEIVKKDGTRHRGRGPRVASRSVSLCEAHTQELFLLVAALIEQVRHGTPPEEL